MNKTPGEVLRTLLCLPSAEQRHHHMQNLDHHRHPEAPVAARRRETETQPPERLIQFQQSSSQRLQDAPSGLPTLPGGHQPERVQQPLPDTEEGQEPAAEIHLHLRWGHLQEVGLRALPGARADPGHQLCDPAHQHIHLEGQTQR